MDTYTGFRDKALSNAFFTFLSFGSTLEKKKKQIEVIYILLQFKDSLTPKLKELTPYRVISYLLE